VAVALERGESSDDGKTVIIAKQKRNSKTLLSGEPEPPGIDYVTLSLSRPTRPSKSEYEFA